MQNNLDSYSRIVIKLGSALLVDSERGLRANWLDSLASEIAELKSKGTDILIVSSGAIALGRNQFSNLKDDQLGLSESQAAAAIGQIELGHAYATALGKHQLQIAQVLLTIGDTETRKRYLNARSTIETLLNWNAIPIINENDTVATSEIRYGDNDRLAARVATMVNAELLVLLSDVDGLYTDSPERDPNATRISLVDAVTEEIEAMAGGAKNHLSRGGMKTKIQAAKIATSGGVTMVIGSGKPDHPLSQIDKHQRCTWFKASDNPITERKKWIAGGLGFTGKIVVDQGAIVALEAGKSLLPAGVTHVEGEFDRGDTVEIMGPNGHCLGRGLIEYNFEDASKIIGMKTEQIQRFLGNGIRSTMIHRDNMALNR